VKPFSQTTAKSFRFTISVFSQYTGEYSIRRYVLRELKHHLFPLKYFLAVFYFNPKAPEIPSSDQPKNGNFYEARRNDCSQCEQSRTPR
jgi:hypothetical protein